MAGETRADLPTLQAVAGRLRDAGESLDELGSRVPPTPQAGDLTPDIGALIGHLTDVCGNLVVGLKEAGDRVEQARTTYAHTDASAADGLF
ncbi:hypothetical protein [Actinoplanes solisilvae]|uniref:hypothetical protein n=1 Tax=Actinoplanes solisilvae TaxID=2486853 RepID=UPI000FD961C3|nr:hypothetical protein [Actinoplanes solisilvae]